MKTSTKLLSMFSAFCFSILLGLTANGQSITVSGGLTASQMAQALVGTNVTVTNATFTGAAGSAGLFNQASSTFPLTDGIILTSGSINNALGPNNSTGATTANNFPGDADLNALIPGYNTFDACVLEFDITSNCNTVTFDYIFASEEYLEYGCSNFNDVFGFLISGPGYAPNTNIALVPGTTTPVSINNVINSPATGCVSNPTYYVDNAAGVATQYDGYTVVMTATATIQPCQTYHVKIVVGDAGDSVLDSAIFLKGGGINCSNPNLTATATTTGVECGSLGSIDVTVSSGTGPFTYAWTGPNGFTSSSEDLTGLAAGDYTVDINGSDCLSSGQFTFNVPNNPDVTAPVISNCPTDVTVTATSGCSAAVNFTAPTATDNCGTPTLTSNYSSGDVFPVGTTAVTYTATDGSGNTSTCTFNVTVNAAPMSVSLTPSMFNGGVNIRCYGQNSGWADADVTGGCGPYTYDWVINGTSIPNGPDLVTGLYAGSVTVTVTDANGTSVTQNVTLIQNPPVQSVPTATPILCYGGTSTITVTATGGTAPYAGTNTYTNMGPGTYQFTVADANGCRDRQPITITQPDLLDVTATPTAIICNGDTSAVTVAATGGTMPYTGTGVYPQVAGSYSYTVTDANGCTETVDLTINEPAPLTALASYTPILCYGGTSQVTVSVISGTEPYTGTGVFTEYAGTYTYQVYDYNLCEDTVTITIPEPPLLVVTATAGSIDCNGGSADVVVSATGGTAPYTGTGTFNETAGTYTYTVTDANGCTDSATVTLAEPTPLSASISSTGIDCFGGTADITVTATGGTAPYTGTGIYNVGPGSYSYVVTDANGCSFVTDTITIIEPTQMTAYASCPGIACNGGTTDLAVTAFGGTPPYTGTGVFTVTAGTYTYTITDANGCTATVTHTVTEPAPLVVSISSTGIDCSGGTADVTVSATGGTAPYTGTGTFNVGAGTYTYTVTDANGCSTTETITVAEPAPLVATATASSILCNGGTADVTVTATGGTAPYTGTGTFNESAGTYTYTVTDANGCTATTSVTLTEPSLMIAYASCPGIACNGGTTDLAVTAFGGTPPYTGTGVFTVTAGTYTYTITDANGCTASVTHTITEPAPLVVSLSSTGIDCNGGMADVTVSATGGTAPYTGTGTFNVGAGTYTYTVTDANGCSTTETITVAEPAPLVATATAASILCNGGTADVTVTATGGTAPYTGTGTFNESAGTYTYTVTDANGCTATTSVTLTEPSLMTAYASCPGIACNGGTTDLAVTAFGGTPPYTGTGVFTVTAGTYTYTITDANGCTASVTHTITEPAPLVVSISSTGIDCNGGTADLTVSATGGTAPYTGTGTFNVGAGTYTYTVTDANGCSTTETITVAEPAPLVATATAASILCNGGTADVTVTATGGTAPYTGTGTFNESAGTYTYTVTDANGCTATTSVTLTEPSLMTAYASCPVIDCNGGTADMAVFAFGGTPPYSGVGVFNVGAGTYTYTVTDANGCTATVTHTVTEPAPLVVSISSTGIDCNGGTADVTVSATGGTAPYTGTGTFNVGAGTYTYTVTDANGCSTTETITVAEPAALVATATAASILCNGGTADVTVTATGGTAPYTGTGTFNESAGTYTYTVTDANGCTATTSVTLTEPSLMTAYASCPGIACNGGTTDLAVTAFGGTPPYTGTGVFTVTAGTYTYTITDANGCTASVTHTITEPAPLVVSISSTGIDCNGGTADVTVSATGGTAPYTGTGTFNVGAGTYTYTVTDANGCSTTETITVAEPAALSTSATSTSILCNGGSSDITITAAGGTPPYTGTGVYSVTAGTYTYTVTDANGCSTDVTITVTEPTALSATATVGTYDCSTDTAPITVVATGGTTPYTGVGVFNEASGNYTFTVTDANGCTATTNTVTVDVQYFVDLTCPGDQVYACTSNQSCGSSSNGATVSWDEPTASSFSTCNTGCGPVQQICGYNYIGEYGGSRYYRSTSSNYTWQEANTAATLAGGYLVSIGSAGENQFVQSQLGCSYAWIGYNDQNSEGSFEWTSGENVTYENWANYEPNNGGGGNSCGYCGDGDYVAMRSNGKWYDKVNCNDYRFVMEIPCGNPITITQTSGPANGSFLSGGTTEVVTYVATDQVTGATATCSFTITVEECVPEYCESSAACTAYEWIDQVSLGSIGNQSGNDNGYGDYTSMTTVASPGDVVNLQLTPGFSGASYTETWRVWVDWNYDGDFYDQGELVYQGYGNSTLNGSFTVPSWATTDLGLRVRVSMRWNCYAGPCSYFQYGEVEDYTLFVNGGIQSMAVNNTINGTNTDSFKDNGFTPKNNVDTYSEVIEDVSVGGIGLELGDIYPNPVLASNGLFNLNIRTGQKTDVSVRIVDLSGKVLLTEVMQLETGANKRQLDVTGFARGSYLVEVISENLKETTQLVVQ